MRIQEKKIGKALGILTVLAVLVLVANETVLGQSGKISSDEVGFSINLEGGDGHFSKAVNIFLLMSVLSLAPAFIMMMTSFTRIIVVLSFVRQAMRIQSPSHKLTAALALFLTFFIMKPVWQEVQTEAIQPYSAGEITQKKAMERAVKPMKKFMLKQTREKSLSLFMDIAEMDPVDSPKDLPMRIVVPSFMVSELKTAFQIGFLIYLPFLVVDIVIATVLMSMGMIMLPPMMISMPFKLLLFVMVDGWHLVVESLVTGFL